MSEGSTQKKRAEEFQATRRYRRAAKILGSNMRRLRDAKGWTLQDASDAADVDLKHWQKIEAAQINVTLVTLVRIAEGLSVAVSELFVDDFP